MNARTALPWSLKRTVFTQEVLRVLLSCSKYIPWEQTTAHVSELMKKLQYSGYSHKFRYEVACSGVKAYNLIKRKEEDGVRLM